MKLEDTPWFESTPIMDHPLFLVFEDKYPVTKGHLLFVPKQDDPMHRKACYEEAYDWGTDLFQKGYCTGCSCLLGLKLTIDLVNFAAAKGKMFVM